MVFFRHKIWRYGLCIFFVLGLNFLIVQLMPGDPLVHLVGEEAYFHLERTDPQGLADLRAKYGLDRPVLQRFLFSMVRLAQFRLGWSFHYGRPVAQVLLYRLKWTLVLLGPALLLASTLGLFLGCLSGRPGANWIDRMLTPLFLTLYSVPAYCLGFLLLLIFLSFGDFFPLGGMRDPGAGVSMWDLWRHMLLPQTVLVLHATAYLYVIMRSTVRQIFGEAYVITALGKGLKPRRVLMRHVLPNALPSYVTAVAVNFGFIAGGALLVEVVFSWQGMGSLMYEAVMSRDYPILWGCFLVLSFSVIGANALADIFCFAMDPRIRNDRAVF
jgi:peptide/nickel transport system permease protein